MAFRKDPDGCYRVLTWSEYPWLEHGFGTRAAYWPDPGRCVTLKQVHSANSLLATGRAGCLGEGDALITNLTGHYLSVRTADCVPVLLIDTKMRVAAAIHAGWRGTVARIAPKTLLRMQEEFGTRAESVEAALGPAIGPCCYEVGPEVARQFKEIFPERMDLDARTAIDLVEANRRQLVDAGLRPSAVFAAGLCTLCQPREFHSFRRDREAAGRLVSAVGLRDKESETRTARGRIRSRRSQ